MTNKEIIDLMNKAAQPSKVNEYRAIYKLSTGTDWTQCLCGNGFNNLYNACKKYASTLKPEEDEK